MTEMEELVAGCPVIPLLTIERADDAVPLARALAAAGLPVMEVGLRSEAALAAVAAIANEVPEAVPGVGMVVAAGDLPRAVHAGARFAVSPGLSRDLAGMARAYGLPYMPGAVTPTEVMAAMEMGLSVLRFFPGAALGGRELLRTYAEPFPRMRFCPAGGVDEHSAFPWLALPNVICVAADWVAPPELVAARDWERIADRAAHASRLR